MYGEILPVAGRGKIRRKNAAGIVFILFFNPVKPELGVDVKGH